MKIVKQTALGFLLLSVMAHMTAAISADNNFARDPKIAVKEEYDLAVKRNTVDALELFIARHPQSELAKAAAERIKSIRK